MDEKIETPSAGNPKILTKTNQLFVPIEVDALFLTEKEAAKRKFAKPIADFSKLPYIHKNQRHNADTAYISEEIVTKPFEESVELEKGVHLYWKLPDFLRHGYSPEGSDSHFFPLVPDCWLVTRFIVDNQSSPNNKTWLVKSSALSSTKSDGITVLNKIDAEIPFVYLGKKIEIDSAVLLAPDDSYSLTALGYGDPTFSAMYTSCRNVFGIYDNLADFPDTSKVNLAYHVCGWYANPNDDLLYLSKDKNTGSDNYNPCVTKAGMELPFSVFEKIRSQMLEKAGVQSDFSSELNLFCNGGVANINQQKADESNQNEFKNIKLYIGNTEEEAISCLLAQQKSKIPDKNLEKLLNAFQLGLIQKIDQLDGSKVVDELLQNSRFVSESGEKIWIVRKKDDEDQDETSDKKTSSTIQLSAQSSALLEDLNQKEQNLQFLESKLESLRFQVFCDWYKFMMIHYSDNVIEVKQTPDDDKLRSFILYKTSRVQKIENEIETLRRIIDQNKNELENALRLEPTADLVIKQQLGPRFWKPKEPILLFYSDKFPELKISSEKITLKLPSMTEALKKLLPFFNFLEILSDELFSDLNQFALFRGNEFRKPLLMDWETTCYISQRNIDENAEFYDPDFIINQYELNEFDAELGAKAGNRYVSNFTHNGTSVLSDSGGGNLKQQLESLEMVIDKDDSFFDKIYAQSISGFNDELLMFKSTSQLPVRDPMGETSYLRNFSDFIANIVGSNNLKAPQPHNHFSPIREGIMQIKRIRFTDYFGQVAELPLLPENISVSSNLVANFDDAHFYLPPRIVQPSRLHFRWCSSQDKTKEAVPGSANSPILGWVLHDKMDNTLTFYHPTGEMLCELRDKEGKIEIIGSNGRKNTYGQSEEVILNDADAHLAELIRAIVATDSKKISRFSNGKILEIESQSYFQCLINQIDQALVNVNPQAEDNSTISMLFGKPLAIVRASLDLQLKEYPSANYNWEKTSNFLKWDEARLISVIDNEALDSELSDGFCNVRIPVKLGDYNKQNDSLVLYFREKNGKTDFSSFRVNEGNTYFTINPDIREDYNINLSVNSPMEYLTMLLYPVGSVHAVTGVLPVKSIDLPSIYYENFLRNFEISFRVGPVLTNRLEEAAFAAYKPMVEPITFNIFKNDATEVLNYLKAKQFTVYIELIRYIESLHPDLLGKFKSVLLPRSIYLTQSIEDAQSILNNIISTIEKMIVVIENLLQKGTTNLISFSKLGMAGEITLQMENVAKSYFSIQRVAYLLSATEWKEVQAKYFEKTKEKIEQEICEIIEIEMIGIPFASIEATQAHLDNILKDKIVPVDLSEIIIEFGKEPEAEMYVPAPKPEAQIWSFLSNSDQRIEEFSIKDNNSAEQFDLARLTALDGWLLLKNNV